MTDPELNERLALALGWIDIACLYTDGKAGPHAPVTGIDPRLPGVRQRLPDYLTGDGMLLVLAEMREKGWEAQMSMERKITTPFECRVFLMNDRIGSPEKRAITHADTLPRAVALAAIAALEEKADE